jgi:EAL domain-containing protein (putative c-di-GMP-specific phosphodiesterase class I)
MHVSICIFAFQLQRSPMNLQNNAWALCATIDPAQPEAVIPIDRDTFVIGRKPGLDLTLESPFVSGRHLELSTVGGRLFALDLSSRNGVLINGQWINRSEVGIGDIIRIADINFCVDRLEKVQGGKKAVSRWVSSQFPRLFRDHAVTTLMEPVFDLDTQSVAGYQAVIQGRVSGLESMERMFAAARAGDRESDLAQLCLREYAAVARIVRSSSELYLSTPLSQNLPVVLIPALRDWRDQFSGCRPIIEIHHPALRTLHSLQDFQQEIQELGLDFALASFGIADLEVVRKSQIKPACVVLARHLTDGIAAKSPFDRRRLATLVDVLRFHEIRVRATGVACLEDQLVCRALGIVLAQGPHLGEPLQLPSKPLPETAVPFQLPDATAPTGRATSAADHRKAPNEACQLR